MCGIDPYKILHFVTYFEKESKSGHDGSCNAQETSILILDTMTERLSKSISQKVNTVNTTRVSLNLSSLIESQDTMLSALISRLKSIWNLNFVESKYMLKCRMCVYHKLTRERTLLKPECLRHGKGWSILAFKVMNIPCQPQQLRHDRFLNCHACLFVKR